MLEFNLGYLSLLPGDPGVDAVLLLEEVDGDGQRGRGGRGAESRRESVRHVGDEPAKFKSSSSVPSSGQEGFAPR